MRALALTLVIVATVDAQQPLHTLAGAAAGDRAGGAVALLGDTDGDRIDDFAVGSPGSDANGIDAGRVQMLSGAGGSELWSVDGAEAGDAFGTSLADGGDVDGDGFHDLIVGAPGANAGRAVVLSGADGALLHALAGANAGDAFGTSVSSGGDANGDGFADVFVGAPGADANGTDAGQVVLFSGKDGSVLLTVDGDAAGDAFGSAVALMDDLDGDCAADLVVGAPGAGGDAGRAQVRSSADGSVLHTVDGGAGDRLGAAVAGAGDANADGSPDWIAGAPDASNNGTDAGRVLLLSGSDGTILFALDGAAAGDRFGTAVHGAGDVDADGSDDFIAGSPEASIHGTESGRAQVFSGADGNILRTFDGTAARDHLGAAVGGARDVNGDGFPDSITGAPGDGETTPGQALVFARPPVDGVDTFTFHGDAAGDRFGRAVGDAGDVDNDGVPDFIVGAPQDPNDGYARIFSGADHTVVRTIAASSAIEHFGAAVDGVGDLDGDGFGEVVIGAPHHTPTQQLAGRAAVYSGADGSIMFEWFGVLNFAHAGFAVSAGGTVDADSIPDVIVGVVKENPNRSGKVRVFSGDDGSEIWSFDGDGQDDFLGWTVRGVGDLNNDGHADLIAGAPENRVGGVNGPGYARVFSGMTGATLFTFPGDDLLDMFGFAVGGGGDVDADGTPDLIVGGWGDDDTGIDAGTVRVFSGVDGSLLHDIDGAAAGDQLGFFVGSAGDVDGDGFDDILAGAPGTDVGGTADAGRAFVFSGRDASVILSLDGATTLGFFGGSAAGLGDTNGDGYPDLIVGAFDDDGSGSPAGSAFVYESAIDQDPGHFTFYGAACTGSDGSLPRIHTDGRPVLGQSFDVSLSAALPGAAVAIAFGATSLPIPLGGGAPGCALLTLPLISAPGTADAEGKASVPNLLVPNAPSLVGQALYGQWVVFDALANPIGVAVSNGVCVVIGS